MKWVKVKYFEYTEFANSSIYFGPLSVLCLKFVCTYFLCELFSLSSRDFSSLSLWISRHRFLIMSQIIVSPCLVTTFKSKVLKIQLCTFESVNNNNKKAFASAACIFIKMKVWVMSSPPK